MRCLLLLAMLATLGCSHREESQRAQLSSVLTQGSGAEEGAIPLDVTFSVIDSSIVPSIKRSLDVRLNQKVSEQTLQAIAIRLKEEDPKVYERTFIAYYLPDMAVGAGAWATTHFDPNLEVRIIGLSTDDDLKLVAQPQGDREIIGHWLDSSPFVGSRITIFREEGKFFIEKLYMDGSSLSSHIIESKSPLGRRFDELEKSGTGDHWVLRSNGNLEIRDAEGLIATVRREE